MFLIFFVTKLIKNLKFMLSRPEYFSPSLLDRDEYLKIAILSSIKRRRKIYLPASFYHLSSR